LPLTKEEWWFEKKRLSIAFELKQTITLCFTQKSSVSMMNRSSLFCGKFGSPQLLS
jgi:hypothetical protein